ncbi:Hypothetical predicted protein [Scomber scombrus]|uniref:Secreted protein n=1 Tax=Scomber scombrus TaxID=13677 RepID=A0AAV1Q2Y8_SCOSC
MILLLVVNGAVNASTELLRSPSAPFRHFFFLPSSSSPPPVLVPSPPLPGNLRASLSMLGASRQTE